MAKLRFRFQTITIDDIDVHVRTLRDTQQFYDPDHIARDLGISSSQWSIFGVVWPSSIVLANYVATLETKTKQILEIGCGIGLTSLFLQHKNRNITATDYHPNAETFLQYNADLNGNPRIPFIQSDWNQVPKQVELFNLIIGSDLLYEEGHVEGLASFVNHHSEKISTFILVDPGRGFHNKLKRRMELDGFSCKIHKPQVEGDFKGRILTFTRG